MGFADYCFLKMQENKAREIHLRPLKFVHKSKE